jgi:hypothetical protein
MKVYFNGNSYNTGNMTKRATCSGCIIGRGPHVKCPIDSKKQCVLPIDKIYTNCASNQIFKL